LRTWISSLLKFSWGAYLLLTSVYCLLAFLPYTYFALIKAPAYAWMPWFARHQALLYWIILAGVAVASWHKPGRNRMLAVLGAGGTFLLFHPFLPNIENRWPAYVWSLVALMPLCLYATWEISTTSATRSSDEDRDFNYSPGIVAAVIASLVYGIAREVFEHSQHRPLNFGLARMELGSWSVLSHVLIAIIVVSVLNLVRIATRRLGNRNRFRRTIYGALMVGFSGYVIDRFLSGALSFDGWMAHVYALLLSISLAFLLALLIFPILFPGKKIPKGIALAMAAVFSLAAMVLPSLIGGGDWNGVLQHTFAIIFWILLTGCVYTIRPAGSRMQSATRVLAILVISVFSYKTLQATAIFWARPLGATDDEVAIAMANYAAHDTSFSMAHHFLGNARESPCGDLCRIMRQYTNIRDAQARTEVRLVEHLRPTSSLRPNIFIFVIDSVRPDYIGAYNPRVDFTPNLDALARDGVALRNVFTQYAGTTLSEPAIWSGAMLLHAHYMQPFSKVNSLEKLARADSYQLIVSYDTVLSQLLSPSADMIKLDQDKSLWNRYEACSTIRELETSLDTRPDKNRPVLFYAQPMNVHQFASNNMPGMTASNWRHREGFNDRVALELNEVDQCLGGFFSYLKAHSLYDESVIIVTSDHGDATGELGRFSHSVHIFPEVMRVPLIVHLPKSIRERVVYDDTSLSALTDITPSLYYLLGHRPIEVNPVFGRPLFAETREELAPYRRHELFLASDERAVYGLLADNGRFLFTTYDSPAASFLFDLSRDPDAMHNLLTPQLERHYGEQVIEHLHEVADFYGYKPGIGSLLAAER
jgi:phosphoglycerol transferase MdoB-like AlkP superfamily enzyme